MKTIQLPLKEEDIRNLHAGDAVLLNGTIYTARDAAHKKLVEMIENHEPLPFDLHGATIYYVGPTPARSGQVIGSSGPTTSSRMDPYVKTLAECGMKGMIGKGRRSDEVKQAIKDHEMVYFVCAGGVGALLSHCIIKREMVAFEELLAEAVTKLEVKDFPCFVGCDIDGNDIYDLEEEA